MRRLRAAVNIDNNVNDGISAVKKAIDSRADNLPSINCILDSVEMCCQQTTVILQILLDFIQRH